MHRRWKCIGIVVIWGCMAGCPNVAGLVGGNSNPLAAFGAAANAAATGNPTGGNLLLPGGGGLNAGGGTGGVPNLGIPLQQSPVPAQPGGFAGVGSGP